MFDLKTGASRAVLGCALPVVVVQSPRGVLIKVSEWSDLKICGESFVTCRYQKILLVGKVKKGKKGKLAEIETDHFLVAPDPEEIHEPYLLRDWAYNGLQHLALSERFVVATDEELSAVYVWDREEEDPEPHIIRDVDMGPRCLLHGRCVCVRACVCVYMFRGPRARGGGGGGGFLKKKSFAVPIT